MPSEGPHYLIYNNLVPFLPSDTIFDITTGEMGKISCEIPKLTPWFGEYSFLSCIKDMEGRIDRKLLPPFKVMRNTKK
jgi:hypothetical protein